uniref:Carboxypeptidase regulatory-like domain-containing protein n=1 Tax=candidate division CPR3 bacterium TaxID=2268181 RepID=A0A7C4R6D4_UNCC3
MKKTNKKEEAKKNLDSSMWRTERKINSIVLPIAIVIALVSLIGMTWFAFQGKNNQKKVSDLSQEIESMKKTYQLEIDDLEERAIKAEKELEEKNKEEEKKKEEEEAEKSIGFIEGSLSYPSSYIPQNMKVCAQNLKTKKEYCTTEQLYGPKYTYNVGYKLEVPAGEYNVYASVPEKSTEKAYYSEYVKCGLKSNCNSHEPVKVTVSKDQITEEIDPVDWYNK